MANCSVCPFLCQADRSKKRGVCGAGEEIEIAWSGKHFGEEPPISTEKGSGAIFFCSCNLKCVYCQNWQISQENSFGRSVSESELIKIIFDLQDQDCQNINLVSPTVWTKPLIKVLKKVKKNGLKIPVIWNSNTYEREDVLKSLSGLVDFYLPDYKYDDESLGFKYSAVKNYPAIAKKAILEMKRQVGNNLIVRHLIIPGQIQNTLLCLKFIRSISPKIKLSLMTQYNPVYKANEFEEINRRLSKDEFNQVMKEVGKLDFEEGWIQEFDQAVLCLTPDFKKENPFL